MITVFSALVFGSVFICTYLHVCLYYGLYVVAYFSICVSCPHAFMCVPMLWYVWLCVFVYRPVVFVFICNYMCVPMLWYVWVCVFVYRPVVFVFICNYMCVPE